MNVWKADRRVIDCFVSLAEGAHFYKGVIVPHGCEGLVRDGMLVDAMVPFYTRDWGSGGPILNRERIYPVRSQGRLLEAGMRIYVESVYGAELPPTFKGLPLTALQRS